MQIRNIANEMKKLAFYIGLTVLHNIADRYKIEIVLQTRKIKSMFKLKDQNYHKSHLVYEGQCSCGEKYIGETQRNFSVRINEHQNKTKLSEPARHLNQVATHSFTWRVITPARQWGKRKIVEALMIEAKNPSLNRKLQAHPIFLFPMGIT